MLSIVKKISNLINYWNHDHVFIYQMGKVGSRSIKYSLEKSNVSAYSHHTLNKHKINQQLFKCYKIPFIISIYNRIHSFRSYRSDKLRFFIDKNKKNFKVITIVREPISRNESFFFEDLHIPIMHMSNRDWTWSQKRDNINALIDEYFNFFNHSNGINWFDNEIKKHLGIDVYDYEFDKNSGFSIINDRNINLLIIKMEKLRENGEEAIKNFLGLENFNLEEHNLSADKWYSNLLKDFRNQISYSQNFADNLYNSKYLQHFYTEDEIKEFYLKIKIEE